VTAGHCLSQSAKDLAGPARPARDLPGCQALEFGTVDLFASDQIRRGLPATDD